MRIMMFGHDYTISGASLLLYRLASRLIEAGHQVDVMSVTPTPGPLSDMFREIGAGFPETVRSDNYDLCLGNTIFTGKVVAQFAPVMKTVWWIHEAENGLGTVLTDTEGYWRAFASIDRIITQTSHAFDNIYRSFVYQCPQDRLRVVPNGVSLPEGIGAKPGSGKFRIVSLGNLDFRKRQGDLIEALWRLNDPEIELILIGRMESLSDSANDLLQGKASSDFLSRVTLTGALDHREALEWLRSADLVVHPAGIESQPLVLFEAGWCNKPMIVADLPVYQGLWKHGDNCLMHPVGDIELLSELINCLVRSEALRKRLGEHARATAERFPEHVFWEKLMSAIMD